MDPDEDDPWVDVDRDIALSFIFDVPFKCGILERLLALGKPRLKNAKWTAVQLSILAQAVAVYGTGEWISYSRNRKFYLSVKHYAGLP